MASITKRGDSYRIAVSNGYRSNGKKIVQTKTWTPPPGMTAKQTERELQRLSVEFENLVKHGMVLGGNVTLASFSEKWLTDHVDKQLEPTTAASYRHEIKTKILPALGHLRIADIQPVHIMAFMDQMSGEGIRIDKKPGGYSHRTIKYQYDILSSMLQSAVYWQLIPTNPCERVKPPARKDVGQQKLKHFSDDQAVRFLTAVTAEETAYQVLAFLGVYVGCRNGELLALTWDDVDLDNGMVSISKQHAYLPDRGVFIKDTKTAGSVRNVSIPSVVTNILKSHKAAQAERRLRLGDKWHDNNLVNTTWDGRPMDMSTPRRWLKRFITEYNATIVQDTNLTVEQKTALTLPLIPYHGLRHTSATLLITQNVDVKTASARLGHSQVSTYTDTYSHFLKSSDRNAADKLESLLEKKTKKEHA